MRRAFTLIELLVVIAIIAILSVVVVLALNPSEMLRQSRDSNRLADMDTLVHAISQYQADQNSSGSSASLGSANTLYLSLPDSSSACGSWNMPSLPAGWSYHCSPIASYSKNDSTGWLPVNFQNDPVQSLLGSLPVDPQNTSSTGLYYSYATDGNQYELTSLFESAKDKLLYAQNPIIQNYPEVDARGSSLSLNPLFSASGLVGYWPMDEGTGSTSGVSQTADQSGNSNNGTWYGTAAGTNSTYYTTGKVGSYAGNFDGSTDFISLTTGLNPAPLTVSVWIKATSQSNPNDEIVANRHDGTKVGWDFRYTGSNVEAQFYNAGGSLVTLPGSSNITLNVWTHVAVTFTGMNWVIYLNGSADNSGAVSSTAIVPSDEPLYIAGRAAGGATSDFGGSIDDVRIYNRALSAAEISALYNAEK